MVPVQAKVLADDLLAVVLVEGLGESKGGREGGEEGRVNTEEWMRGGAQIDGGRVLWKSDVLPWNCATSLGPLPCD
jgi:hypothetical protein